MNGSPDEPFIMEVSTNSEDRTTPMEFNRDTFWRHYYSDTAPWVLFKVNVPGNVTLVNFVVESIYSEKIEYQVLADDKVSVLYDGVSNTPQLCLS